MRNRYARWLLALALSWAITCVSSCSRQESTPGEQFDLKPRANGFHQNLPQESQVAHLLAVVYSSDERGEIRSPGAKKADLGGLGRRATFLEQVRAETHDVLALHAGDLFAGNGQQARLKAGLAVRTLAEMRYDAVTLGELDLSFGRAYLEVIFKEIALPIVSCNVVHADTHKPFAPHPYILKEMLGGYEVLILGATSQAFRTQFEAEGLKVLPLEETLRRYLRQLASGRLVIVLAHAGRDEASQLARSVPGIDLIVVGHMDNPPLPAERAWRVGDTLLVVSQPKGRHVGRLNLSLNDKAMPVRMFNEHVPMDNTLAEPEGFLALFKHYQAALRELVPAGAPGPPQYATAQRCYECHEQAAAVWVRSQHARAMESLVSMGQEFDPECVGCHSLGYGKPGGFVSLETTPKLANVQCENCHGPGLDHLLNQDAPYGENAAQSCVQCHTDDFSPDFHYAEYWKEIIHQ